MRRALLVLLAALLAAPAASAWSWPVEGRVLAPFVFDPANPYAAGQHRGVDVAGSVGDPVRAPAAGTVSFAGAVPGGPPRPAPARGAPPPRGPPPRRGRLGDDGPPGGGAAPPPPPGEGRPP